jgi:NtrC-family two-component system sensor histidine kinase KinB
MTGTRPQASGQEGPVLETAPGQEPDERQIEAMRKRLRELTFLHETSQVLTATLDLDDVLRSLMTQVRDYFQVEAASVALQDEESEELVFRVAVGKAAEEVVGLRLAPGQGIASWVVQNGQPELVPAAYSDERFYPGIDDKTDFHTRTMLAVPVKIGQQAIGVIEAINPAAGTFDEDAQRLLLAVADLAAVAIRNAELHERMRRAERRYESLFNESTDPTVVLDMEWRILEINRQAVQMLGRPREQLSGADFRDALGMPQETCQTAIQQVREGQRFSLEMRVPSGEEPRILETHMAKIDYGGREAIQWVGHDISERVALEQMREDLTHMIIHDLRNPLGSMMSSLQLIHAAFVDQDQTLPTTKLLRIAMRSGLKLYRRIDSLLDLGRLEAGETELKKTPVSPESLIEEAVEQIQPSALNKEQTIVVQVDPGLPRVPADRDLILRVLTNLLDNAVKFTPKEGRITLSVRQTGEEMLFAVSDTGPGIAPEYRQRVFDRFVRLETTEGLRGTGLGLAFCKLAVEAHGGRIWVESEADHGATFHFVLPLEAE